MKVRIIKDWDHPNFFQQTPGGSGIWGDIEFTERRVLNCDVLVILNSLNHSLFTYCRRGGRWLMSQEPPYSSYLWQTKGYKYLDAIFCFWNRDDFPKQNIINVQTSLPWHVRKSYDELASLDQKDLLKKKDEVSWVTSSLNTRPGHALRLNFMDYLQRSGFPLYLFGRGFESIDDKFEAIYPYKYSIAIENFSCNDYWTEKIADCFLSWTMPVYYGCSNITSYFPEQSMILIDPNNPEVAKKKISEAMNRDKWGENIKYLAEARDLVLNKYQFFPAISERIKATQLGSKRFYLIRKPSFE